MPRLTPIRNDEEKGLTGSQAFEAVIAEAKLNLSGEASRKKVNEFRIEPYQGRSPELEKELVENNSNETELPSQRTWINPILKPVLITAVITTALFTLGWFGILAIQESDQKATDIENARVAERNDEVAKAQGDAIRAYRDFIAIEYTRGKLVGDNLEITDIELNEGVRFKAHLLQDGKNVVIDVALSKFKDLNGNEYWLAYRPTTLQAEGATLDTHTDGN